MDTEAKQPHRISSVGWWPRMDNALTLSLGTAALVMPAVLHAGCLKISCILLSCPLPVTDLS
jgi:hypothetical protein